MSEHRRGRIPVFPRRHGSSGQDLKLDKKPNSKSHFRKLIAQPRLDEMLSDEDRGCGDGRHGSSKQDTKPSHKLRIRKEIAALFFRKHVVHPQFDERISDEDQGHRDGRNRSSEQDTKLDTKPDTKPSDKHSFRKHLVQPHSDERISDEDRDRRDARFRLYWRKSGQVKTEPVSHSPAEREDDAIMKKLRSQQQTKLSPRLRFNSVRKPGEASTQDQSRTSEWLSRFASDGTVVPKQLSSIEFPAGSVAVPTPQIPRKRRTNEDKANVEAVLITPVPSLTDYLSAEMIDMIRTSPFYHSSKDVVIFRSDMHRTRGQNAMGCFKHLTLFIRNVANEIVYRERRIAAEERMYREDGAYEDPE